MRKMAGGLVGVTSAEFKSMLHKKEGVGPNLVVFKGLNMPETLTSGHPLSAIFDVNNRSLGFTCSTSAVDRERDVIVQEGWDLAKYEANPVFCWQHDTDLPIGRAVSIGLKAAALKAVFELREFEAPIVGPYAELALTSYRTGFLTAVSVGFRPLEYEVSDDKSRNDGDWFPGVNFIRCELCEVSCVTVPANPEALIDPAERMAATAIEAASTAAAAAIATAAAQAVETAAYHARRRLLRAACV